MRNNFYLIVLIVLSLFSVKSYAGGCAPSSSNGSCPTATTLTPGAACVTGTTCDGASEQGTCTFAGSECSWYEFTATATAMYVEIDVTATDGCHISSNVYEASGACTGTEISCLSGTPLDDLHSLTGLTIGNNYYVQVCYSPGGICGNGGVAEYCISVGEPDPLCNTCAAPCGTASGYATAPTVATVVADCQTSPFIPELQPSSTNTFCYSFTTVSTSVDFGVIVTSNCGGGNVTNFSWSLYNSTCGGAIQTGTLASLTFSGLTIGNTYVFCYTFDVPSTCTHSQHCPYFVGAAPLPVTLMSFVGEVQGDKSVQLDWITGTEINNDFFTIEKSKDGFFFEEVAVVDGAGNSNEVNTYRLTDKFPFSGVSYYRLKQTDYDGTIAYSKTVTVNVVGNFADLTIFPNPVEHLSYLSFNSDVNGSVETIIYDVMGEVVLRKNYSIQNGVNQLEIPTSELSQGMYFLSIDNGVEGSRIKFIKE